MDSRACCSPGWRREAKAGLREASSRKREDLWPARRRMSSAIMSIICIIYMIVYMITYII